MPELKFVDLFAGCGGLSLGFSQAGLEGIFAIERDPMAFETFEANLLGNRGTGRPFRWPAWLERKAWCIEELLATHIVELKRLKGEIDVLCGGPPCQGFSFAGRRQEDDPRNLLFNKYVEVVEALKPKAIVLENVPGMKVLHRRGEVPLPAAERQSYYDKLVGRLRDAGYEVASDLVDSSKFGVPQRRSRLIAIGMRKDLAEGFDDFGECAFESLERARLELLGDLRLPEKVSASEAISDLQTKGGRLQPCEDPMAREGYVELAYACPKTGYQVLMQDGYEGPMDSMRLARHRPEITARFERIINECKKGVPMNEAARKGFGLKKQRIHPMSPSEPSPTVTTLPDDILHYSEPRILTVRESARLQSFPDWFHFRGKYTTGGHRRKKECPRYTQVGNAVPPLLARAIGMAVQKLVDESTRDSSQNQNNFMELEAKSVV